MRQLKNYFLIYFLISFGFFQVNYSFANTKITEISLLVDSSKTLNYKDVLTNSSFISIKNGYATKNEACNHWLKIKISKDHFDKEKYILFFQAAVIFDIKCYYQFNDKLIIQQSGLSFKKGSNPYFPKSAFTISLPDTSEFEIYIQSKSKGAVENFLMNFLPESKYHEGQTKLLFMYGFFYGILLLILLINLFYFFSLKKKAFMYYSIYILLTIGMCSYFDGIPLLGLLNPLGKYHVIGLFTAIVLFFGYFPIMAINYVQLKNKRIEKIAKIYFVFCVISVLFAAIFNSDQANSIYFLYHHITFLFGLTLVFIVAIKGLKTNKLLARSFLISMALLVISMFISSMESYGFTVLKMSFDVIKIGSLLEVIILSFALALHFRETEKNLATKNVELDDLLINYLQSQKQFSNMEDSFLRSQMNPHFTFNLLNSILDRTQNNDTEAASEMIVKYSKLLRKVLETAEESFVLFETEVHFLEEYLKLQNKNKRKIYNYKIEISENIDKGNFKIPNMIIQPFIENSCVHGFNDKDINPEITLKFELIDPQVLKCTIEDNGIGINESKEKSANIPHKKSFAIKIVKNRLKKLSEEHQQNFTLEISDKSIRGEQGTEVIILIPIMSM